MTKIAARIIATVYATLAFGVGVLALFGVSAMMQSEVRFGPGNLAITMIPTTVLLGSCALAQFKMPELSGVALILVVLGFVTLAVVWISHLGGGIYEGTGLANLVVAVCGVIFAFHISRRNATPDKRGQ